MFLMAGSRAGPKSGAFPKGTVLAGFVQSAAPLGWTKVSTYNDVGLRVVSGNVSSVTNQTAFSTVFTQTATGAHTLITSEIPSHTHNDGFVSANTAVGADNPGAGSASSASTGSTGGDGSHTHTISLHLNYVDVIVCKKN